MGTPRVESGSDSRRSGRVAVLDNEAAGREVAHESLVDRRVLGREVGRRPWRLRQAQTRSRTNSPFIALIAVRQEERILRPDERDFSRSFVKNIKDSRSYSSTYNEAQDNAP